MIGRRSLLAATVVTAGAFASSSASACSLTANRKPVVFRGGVCEQKIRRFVDFANVAHEKSEIEIEKWKDTTEISPVYNGEYDESLKTLRTSAGKVDLKPIKIGIIELIRQRGNKATYVFTLVRNQYFAADDEGCNGMFTHDEYYGNTTTAYLATFQDNRFEMFKEFPEWYV